MSNPSWNTIPLLGAGEARYDGAAGVITIGTGGSAPAWTSLASNAAWNAIFALPSASSFIGTGNTQYVTHLDFYVEGADIFVTRVASPSNPPTAANGFKWAVGYSEMLRNSPDMLRNMQWFLPAGSKLYVAAYWGSI